MALVLTITSHQALHIGDQVVKLNRILDRSTVVVEVSEQNRKPLFVTLDHDHWIHIDPRVALRIAYADRGRVRIAIRQPEANRKNVSVHSF